MSDRAVFWTGIAVIGLLLIAMIFATIEEKREWDRFAVEHNCRVVGQRAEQSAPTYGLQTNGQGSFGIATIPAQTGFLCDDGVTYWRNL